MKYVPKLFYDVSTGYWKTSLLNRLSSSLKMPVIDTTIIPKDFTECSFYAIFYTYTAFPDVLGE